VSDWQERLVEAISARGISGGELGRRAGFSAQYINSLRAKERGARLPLDTARRIAHALGVSVEWLTTGTGPRERLSDVYPIFVEGGSPPESATLPDRYASRAEAVALLSTTVQPEVISALRAVVPEDPETDPGREHWIEYARHLVRDLERIKADPLLNRHEVSGGLAADLERSLITRAPPPSTLRNGRGPSRVLADQPPAGTLRLPPSTRGKKAT
jgi:transcriptional regulator with XRE-family HTH domain